MTRGMRVESVWKMWRLIDYDKGNRSAVSDRR